MPDRSSHQGPPEEWNHGSHAARGPFSAPAEADSYSDGTAGSHRARTADGHGAGPTDAHGAAAADPLGTRADSFGAFGTRANSHSAGATDAFGARADSFGTSTTDGFGAKMDSYGTGQTDTFGVRPAGAFGAGAPGTFGAAAADPFGDADPFGARKADPFGPDATAAFAAVPGDAGTARPEAERPATAIADPAAGEAADTRGFLGALFDLGFTSFVTPKVIKVLYMLIVIGTVVSALVFTIIAFKASTVFGFLVLVFGDPLFILIVLAIYRIILEFFVVTFRVAEDIRALRERGDLR
jgi:Domain of unknown function (DUF4282)